VSLKSTVHFSASCSTTSRHPRREYGEERAKNKVIAFVTVYD